MPRRMRRCMTSPTGCSSIQRRNFSNQLAAEQLSNRPPPIHHVGGPTRDSPTWQSPTEDAEETVTEALRSGPLALSPTSGREHDDVTSDEAIEEGDHRLTSTPSLKEGGASGDGCCEDFFRNHLRAALKAKKSFGYQHFSATASTSFGFMFSVTQRLPTRIRKPGTSLLNHIVGAHSLGDGGDVEHVPGLKLRTPKDHFFCKNFSGCLELTFRPRISALVEGRFSDRVAADKIDLTDAVEHDLQSARAIGFVVAWRKCQYRSLVSLRGSDRGDTGHPR